MRASQAGPAIGLIAQVLLLAVLAATVGLGAAGWVVGVACAVTMAAALARGLARRPRRPAGAGVVGDARAGPRSPSASPRWSRTRSRATRRSRCS